MAEVIHCPSCQRKLSVPENLFGEEVQCPTCASTFVARPDAAPAASQRPSAPIPFAPESPPGPAQQQDWDDYERRGRGRRRYDDDDDFEHRRRRRDLMPHRGGVVLTFGILSIVLGACGAIFGPIAWVMGQNDLAEIRAQRMDPDGEGTTNAGRICGIIGTILGILNLVGCILYVFFIALVINRKL